MRQLKYCYKLTESAPREMTFDENEHQDTADSESENPGVFRKRKSGLSTIADVKSEDSYNAIHRAPSTTRQRRTDFFFKICTVGDVNVGKTSFLLTLCGDMASHGSPAPKAGISYKETVVSSKAKQKTARCRLEDTAGQERYRSLTSGFYRNCHGCFIVFDPKRAETFNHVSDWFKDVQMYADANICVFLIGAKFGNIADSRTISEEEGNQMALRYEVPYLELNVLNMDDASDGLERLVDVIISKIEDRRSSKMNPSETKIWSPNSRRSRVSTVTRASLGAQTIPKIKSELEKVPVVDLSLPKRSCCY